MSLTSGYVIFWTGAPGSESVDWRAAGQALPAGAVPAIVCDGLDTLTLHGHGDGGFGAAINAAMAEAEAELASAPECAAAERTGGAS